MSTKVIATVGLSLLVLGGCAQPQHLNSDFGDAVRRNMATQIVNPSPQEAEKAPDMNGNRAYSARSRYEIGAVKQVVPERTSKQKVSGSK